MYQNIYVKRTKTSSEVHLWDDKKGYSKFPSLASPPNPIWNNL